MPIFDFECKDCGMLFEYITILNNGTVKCPKCDSKKIIKRIGKSNFILKGSGWSKDNYCNTNSCQKCSKKEEK